MKERLEKVSEELETTRVLAYKLNLATKLLSCIMSIGSKDALRIDHETLGEEVGDPTLLELAHVLLGLSDEITDVLWVELSEILEEVGRQGYGLSITCTLDRHELMTTVVTVGEAEVSLPGVPNTDIQAFVQSVSEEVMRNGEITESFMLGRLMRGA